METEKPTPEYLKAYNLGYWFSRLMPETSKQVGQLDGKSEKNLGFQDGKKQALIEKVLTDRLLGLTRMHSVMKIICV
jgi:hypothetical protein